MSAESFRDILRQFLEEKSPKKGDSMPHPPRENRVFPSERTDIPFIWPDVRPRHSRPRGSLYKMTKTPSTEKKPRVPHKMSRSQLTLEGQKALETLLRLGAQELEESLTVDVIKRAYRRLLKFYHPDHDPLGLSPEERARRVEQFWSLRKSYQVLEADVQRGPRGAPVDKKSD